MSTLKIILLDSRDSNPGNNFPDMNFFNLANEAGERCVYHKATRFQSRTTVSEIINKYEPDCLAIDMSAGLTNHDFVGLGFTLLAHKEGIRIFPYVRDRQIPAHTFDCIEGILIAMTGKSITRLPGQFEPRPLVEHSAADLKKFFEPLIEEIKKEMTVIAE